MKSKSINRPSFRRSSFFPRKVKTCPLLPRIDIFLGLAMEFMTSISSKNAVNVNVSEMTMAMTSQRRMTHI